MLLVANLCLVEIVSTILIYLVVPYILSKALSDTEACASISVGWCFTNFGVTLSTFLLCLERWSKIAHVQGNMKQHDETHVKRIPCSFGLFSISSTFTLVIAVWLATFIYATGSYLFISTAHPTPSVHTCRYFLSPAPSPDHLQDLLPACNSLAAGQACPPMSHVSLYVHHVWQHITKVKLDQHTFWVTYPL